MRPRAKLVPELLVRDLRGSLRFWCGILGFEVVFDRPEDDFAYLDLDGAQVMLERHDPTSRQWLPGPLELPFGRGINFQVEIASVEPILARLDQAAWPLFMACEEKWYGTHEGERGQRQFIVQDPDGYLIRFAQLIGLRNRES